MNCACSTGLFSMIKVFETAMLHMWCTLYVKLYKRYAFPNTHMSYAHYKIIPIYNVLKTNCIRIVFVVNIYFNVLLLMPQLTLFK